MLTATIASAGADRRRAEQALLRARGASARQLLGLAGVEAAVIGVTGSVVGLLGATLVDCLAMGSTGPGARSAPQCGLVPGRRHRRNRGCGNDRPAAGPPRSTRTHHRGRAQPDRTARLPGVGAAAVWTPRFSSVRVWCSSRPPAPDTSWSSHPKACPASRCPTGPSPARPCCGSGRRWRPGVSPTCCSDRGGAHGRVGAAVHWPAVRYHRQQPVPAAPPAGAGHRAARPGDRLRRVHRDIQRDLSAAGRSRRAADQRRGRHRHPGTGRRRGGLALPRHSPGSRVFARSSPSSTASPTSAPTSGPLRGDARTPSPGLLRCRTATFPAPAPPA